MHSVSSSLSLSRSINGCINTKPSDRSVSEMSKKATINMMMQLFAQAAWKVHFLIVFGPSWAPPLYINLSVTWSTGQMVINLMLSVSFIYNQINCRPNIAYAMVHFSKAFPDHKMHILFIFDLIIKNKYNLFCYENVFFIFFFIHRFLFKAVKGIIF